MLRVKSKVRADTITSIEQQIMFQRLKKGIRHDPQHWILPPRDFPQYTEGHPMDRDSNISGHTQQKICPFVLCLHSILRPDSFNGNAHDDAPFGLRLLANFVPICRYPSDLPMPVEDDIHSLW